MIKSYKKQVYKIHDSPVDSPKEMLYEEKSNVANKDRNINSSKKNDINKLGNNPLSIKLTNQNLMEAVIYSEILGKPKCKRRGRCR